MEQISQLVWALLTIASYTSILCVLFAGISMTLYFLLAILKAFEVQPWDK